MSPVTHLLASWLIAHKATNHPRDCRLVTLAGLAPDIDGLGLVVDLSRSALGLSPTNYYQHYHHVLLHGLPGSLLIAGLLAALARQTWRVMFFSFLVFHLHLLCDFVGSRGPEAIDLWPIDYLSPFSHRFMWFWRGQWPLNSWINASITLVLLAWALRIAIKSGESFMGVFHRGWDEKFCRVLHKWLNQT